MTTLKPIQFTRTTGAADIPIPLAEVPVKVRSALLAPSAGNSGTVKVGVAGKGNPLFPLPLELPATPDGSCYDLRDLEVASAQANQGVDVLAFVL